LQLFQLLKIRKRLNTFHEMRHPIPKFEIWVKSESLADSGPSVIKSASEVVHVCVCDKEITRWVQGKPGVSYGIIPPCWNLIRALKLAFVSVCQRHHRLAEANYETVYVVCVIRYSESDWLASMLKSSINRAEPSKLA
jgi:hypothetical protein